MKLFKIFKKKNSFPGEEGKDGLGKKAVDNKSGLSYFYFSYDGTIGGNNYHYRVENKDGVCVFEYETMEHPDYGKMTMTVDGSVLDELNDLYLKYRIAEWEGYSKYNTMVCDGDGFSLSLKFNDKKYMSASGTNAYPERYGQFCGDVDGILDPLRDRLLAEAKEKKINAGISGNINSLIVIYKQYGASGNDEYKFILSKSSLRRSNYDVYVRSVSGQFFPVGEYRAYKDAADEYIPFEQIRELVNKYDLIKWYDHQDSDPDSQNREWYQIHFSFDDGTFLNSSGTVYMQNYDEFRRDFLSLMAEMISKTENEKK